MSKWNVYGAWCKTPRLYPVLDARGCDREYRPNGTSARIYNSSTATVNALTCQNGISIEFGLSCDQSKTDREHIVWAYKNARPGAKVSDIMNATEAGFLLRAFAMVAPGSRKMIGESTDFTTAYHGLEALNMYMTLPVCQLKEVFSPARAKDEPWAFTDKLFFDLYVVSMHSDNKSTQKATLSKYSVEPKGFDVEIYAICPAIPRFLQDEGIPRTLLQFALSSFNKQGKDDQNMPFAEAITRRVFNNGFVYDRTDGIWAFTSGAGRTFELDKFLNIWSVLNKTADNRMEQLFKRRGFGLEKPNKPKVNCYDQTGILGLCMSFACKDEDDRNSLMAYRMSPFGFLKATPLVGFNKGPDDEILRCNNPFTTWTQELLVNKTFWGRTKFGNHVFLMFRKRIYDGCAGPCIGQTLSQYVASSVDSADGSYPTEIWNESKGKGRIKISIAKTINGDWTAAKAHLPSDTHGGIMGQTGNMLKQEAWNRVPRDLSIDLDAAGLWLNIHGLGEWLQNKTTSSTKCKVTSVDGPIIYTGQGKFSDAPDHFGEITWSLLLDDKDVSIHLRRFPSFESAAAERLAMYGGGNRKDLPDERTLGKQQFVCGYLDDVAHATALYGANLIDCESADSNTDDLLNLLQLISESFEEPSKSKMIVGNAKADGKNDEPHRIVMKEPSEIARYFVQVTNCLDIDWSYETGAVFMTQYQIEDRNKLLQTEAKQIVRDPGEPDLPQVYWFEFVRRGQGGDTFKIVFYDRYYRPTTRTLDFRIYPSDN